MLDKMIWKVFEKTGDINAYLLYADIKSVSDVKNPEITAGTQSIPVQIN